MDLFDKFKTGLKRTRDMTIGSLTDLFMRGKIDEDLLERLEEALLEADVGVDSVDELLDRLRERVKEERASGFEAPVELLKTELLKMMDQPESKRLAKYFKKPWVIVLVGVNGSGKTTTAGKLAYMFAQEGKKSAIAAADTFRAAAIEQVEIWAERSGARLIKQTAGADPAAVTYDAYKSVCARGEDVLLVDTAGRLQDKHNLMQELAKITRVLKCFESGSPHEVLLIIDATTGQNGLSQARGFTKSAGVTGLVITKLDGSARGGVIIPILRELGLPIEFVGMGERTRDLYPFEVKAFIDALLAR